MSQNPEPLRGEILSTTACNIWDKRGKKSGGGIMFWSDDDGKYREAFRVIKEYKVVKTDEVSENIAFRIDEMEGKIQGSLTEDEFRNIIMENAMAWAVRNKNNGMFLKEVRIFHKKQSHEIEWTENLRDALIFNDALKAETLALDIECCEEVPLIYQVDPLFVSKRRFI
ncbi:hypothetical protein [Escherichia coli]|uniref:hypothetical protein n=2 Tax=Escherichia coli TaxID=562 RepID=UPI000F877BBC|nr:hypothetical protein [Escherichia coli]